MEIDGLTLDAGQLKQINLRDSSNNEDMTISSGGARGIIVRGGQTSDEFNFASLNYKWNKDISTSYSYGGLDGLYRFMPITGTLAIVACAAMAGVPLLNGFLSKEMFFAETVFVSAHPSI
jgi:hypothetical protein